MPAIIKTFYIKLTERQAGQIRRQFQQACKEAGVSRAAMIAQPKTQFNGIGSMNLKPPVLHCAVIHGHLYEALEGVIKSHRETKKV